jgi:hypothetical protein
MLEIPLAQQSGHTDLFRQSSVRDCRQRLSDAGKALQKRLFFAHARMKRVSSRVLTDAVWLIITKSHAFFHRYRRFLSEKVKDQNCGEADEIVIHGRTI